MFIDKMIQALKFTFIYHAALSISVGSDCASLNAKNIICANIVFRRKGDMATNDIVFFVCDGIERVFEHRLSLMEN